MDIKMNPGQSNKDEEIRSSKLDLNVRNENDR